MKNLYNTINLFIYKKYTLTNLTFRHLIVSTIENHLIRIRGQDKIDEINTFLKNLN